MRTAFLWSLSLVTAGAMLVGHTLVRWAARRWAPADLGPPLAVAFGSVAMGLSLGAPSTSAVVAVRLASLALVVAAVLTLVRKRSRLLDDR